MLKPPADKRIQIRCSMLTSYVDCARRTVCRIIPKQLQDAGYRINKLPTNVGAAIGTSTHLGAETILTEKLQGLNEFNINDATDKAISKFNEITNDGVEWDTTTINRNDAQKQILSMLKEHIRFVAPQIEPVALEKTFRLNIDNDFVLKGTIDVLEKDRFRDLKTGRVAKNNIFQYGGYGLLATYNGHSIKEIKEDFIQRTKKPTAKTISVSPQNAELETKRLIKRVTQEVRTFLKDPSKDAGTFNANPHSQLCSERFCPCYGTKWCSAWREKD